MRASIRTASMIAGLMSIVGASNAQMINEIQPNPVGADPATVSVELIGTPGANFDGVLISIESDPGGANPGLVDRVSTVNGQFDANGLLTASIDDLENPAFTLVLMDSFTGTVGSTDIDANDDGSVLDTTSFGTVFDAIGVPDDAANDNLLYGDDVGGANFAFIGSEPQLIFRELNSGDWYGINQTAGTDAFDINANPVPFASFDADPSVTTFSASNPALLPPAAVAVPMPLWASILMLLGFAGIARRFLKK